MKKKIFTTMIAFVTFISFASVSFAIDTVPLPESKRSVFSGTTSRDLYQKSIGTWPTPEKPKLQKSGVISTDSKKRILSK